MTVAQHRRATSLVVSSQNSERLTHRFWQPIQLGAALVMKLWWHTKAYGTVLIIALLTLISLIFLQIYWSCRRLLQVVVHSSVEEGEWTTFSRK
ncbi:hypothetical protein NUACC21_51710 [Scytonema sp. NUACC21]